MAAFYKFRPRFCEGFFDVGRAAYTTGRKVLNQYSATVLFLQSRVGARYDIDPSARKALLGVDKALLGVDLDR